ncbi:TetR family transcriptional regulator [Subtercola boreus]|uniref:TetR family transcriptional regulator n=1 Tax=Subtercola boreus TaxID=120213 RepID=A0A3E0VLU5_9MICO|nr:TetR family transcriptional regulator [Subtercola boreus]RFA10954.1 TetR family transcriptional regulator [Subtercola boreus]TQL55450.1 TetR family transcriptional regulator [Subtercola boreus]
MGRWEPGAEGRLMQSAMELYVERGFEQTTAAEIAERAGVTERTFFRYFTDKREVLFGGAVELRRVVLEAIVDAPTTAPPLDAVLAGMFAGAALIGVNRGWSRQRAALLAANPSLMERELLKLSALGESAADALRQRGVAPLTARLAGHTGVSVFSIGFDTWVGDDSPGDFPACIRLALAELRELTADA